MNQLILAFLLSLAPISELRGGIPLAVAYAVNNNISALGPIIGCIALNILVIFAVFFFLDFFHKSFMKLGFYRKFFEAYLGRLRVKIDKFEKHYAARGFLALTIFVAVPLPVTGAWTGTLISWLLGLDRKKSIISIAIGVIIAGILLSLGSLGVVSLFF